MDRFREIGNSAERSDRAMPVFAQTDFNARNPADIPEGDADAPMTAVLSGSGGPMLAGIPGRVRRR